jgi:hypothetical protein
MTNKKSGRALLQVSLLAVLIFLSYWGRLNSNLWQLKVARNSYNYDEGIHLIIAKLWAAGYVPYEQIFVSYPPVFIWSLGLPWRLFQEAAALQLLMATYALVGVVAIVYLGLSYRSYLAGITAGIFLSFTPDYFIPSIAVMGEVQSVGIAILAIALAEKYRRGGGWVWLLLAGGSLAFGLSIKILPVYAAPLTALIVLARYLNLDGDWQTAWPSLQASRRLLLRDFVLLGGSFLLVFLLPFAFFSRAALYDQVFEMRLVSRETEFNLFESNTRDIIDFIFENVSLTLLALAGLFLVILPHLRAYWLLLAWFILVWVSMRFHIPLRAKHLPVFLPILSLMAGLGLDYFVNFIKRLTWNQLSLRAITTLFLIGMSLGLALWEIPQVVARDKGQAVAPEENPFRVKAIQFIHMISTPEDCVIADNPVFLYSTDRLPPPQLAEVSTTRIETGYLSLADITQALEEHQCHVATIVTGRFGESVLGLNDWLAQHYLALYNQNDEVLVYFAQKGADSDYTALSEGEFGGLLKLYGVDFTEEKSGRFVSLYWQLQAPLPAIYNQHLILRQAGQSRIVYQTVRQPFAGQFDPAAWEVGVQAKDTFYMELPPQLPPGSYELYLSLCLEDSCLPLTGAPDKVEVYLGQVTLRAS